MEHARNLLLMLLAFCLIAFILMEFIDDYIYWRRPARCADFSYQEDAQLFFSEGTKGGRALDGNDNDGQACEHLPHRP